MLDKNFRTLRIAQFGTRYCNGVKVNFKGVIKQWNKCVLIRAAVLLFYARMHTLLQLCSLAYIGFYVVDNVYRCALFRPLYPHGVHSK